MSVQQSIVNGFISRRGLITYSMLGSRNGSDGTGDCSGIMSQVLKEAGIKIIGAGGHVGAMLDSVNFISCDYSTQGAPGQAINTYPWDYYYNANNPTYIEVWRYNGNAPEKPLPNTAVAPSSSRKPSSKAYYLANDVQLVNGIYQIKCDYLCPVGFDWTENGIPVSLVNWVDENGNHVPDGEDKDFKAGMYFSFEVDEVHITDTDDGGYYGGYYYRSFEFGQFGTVWLSVWDKDDLVNYYN